MAALNSPDVQFNDLNFQHFYAILKQIYENVKNFSLKALKW
jgi:hypothetical protein